MNARSALELVARTAATLAAVVSLGGCVRGVTVPVAPAPPSDPGRVPILATSDPPRPYVVVGVVSASAPDTSAALQRLAIEAASVGADAAIGFRLTTSQGHWVHAYALAVRWA